MFNGDNAEKPMIAEQIGIEEVIANVSLPEEKAHEIHKLLKRMANSPLLEMGITMRRPSVMSELPWAPGD